MRTVLRVVRHGLLLLPLVVVLALVVPGSGVRPTTIGLTKVQSAEAYDFADGVVWVLVLGSDARTGASFREGDTDFFQLLGINFRTGSAAAIGIPRDSWVELPGGLERINNAYEIGGADVAAGATEDLVGIAPDYVMITGEDGFLSMLDTLGPVTVDSRLGFRAEDSDLVVHQGENRFEAQDALDFAVTRTLPRSDFDRSRNHQALLLGLLGALHERQDEPGFIERMGLAAVDGIDTGNLSPLDLYRLLNALTSVDPAKASGCIVLGDEETSPAGGAIVIPDTDLARRLGDDVRDDARFDNGCGAGGSR
jgi:polyisoprenyl-teichoic acid--peptidoglycan teichoic acid transferase